MKKAVWASMALMVLLAVNARAQAISANSWIIGADGAPGGWVKGDLLPPSASIRSAAGDSPVVVEQKKDMWVNLFGGYKPLGKFGGEIHFQGLGTTSTGAGSVAQTEGELILFGQNDTPKTVSSAPVLDGPVAYTLRSSVKISRVDFLANRSWGFTKGWFSVFAGVPVLRLKSEEEIARAQNFLLYARLPNGTLDTKGDREDYSYFSAAAAKGTLFGLTGGIEGERCITRRLVFEGRFGVAVLPWGNTDLNGQFSATKDIYLVNVAGGLEATPTQTIAHLDWAPDAQSFDEKSNSTVTAIDWKVAVKWRARVGKRASLNFGAGISGSLLRNLPLVPAYNIKDPLAVGAGKFNSRTMDLSMWAPMLTIGIWF